MRERDPLCPLWAEHGAAPCEVCVALSRARAETLEACVVAADRAIIAWSKLNMGPLGSGPAALHALRSLSPSAAAPTPTTAKCGWCGDTGRVLTGAFVEGGTLGYAPCGRCSHSTPTPVVTWQHDETGRTVDLPEGRTPNNPDGPQRWTRVPPTPTPASGGRSPAALDLDRDIDKGPRACDPTEP